MGGKSTFKRSMLHVSHSSLEELEVLLYEARESGDAGKVTLFDRLIRIKEERRKEREEEHQVKLQSIELEKLRLASAVPSLDPKQKLRNFLEKSGLEVNEAILSRIVASPWLSVRLFCLSTADEAQSIYQDAEQVPQSETRAIAVEQGVSIDGQLQFPGPQTALFFRAFEDFKNAKVLKVNRDASKTKSECRLYATIGKYAEELGISLVPVRLLELHKHSTHRRVLSSPPRSLNPFQGILMPCYHFTLSDIPKPIPCWYAVEVFKPIISAIDFIHSRGWFHGDVKSANIFCDHLGAPWLGDYGSSVECSTRFTFFPGGTLRYQCKDVSYLENPRLFDGIGLVMSLLDMLEAVDLDIENSLDDIRRSIDQISGPRADELQILLKMWIDSATEN